MRFEDLRMINVNDYTEGKNGLTYLSWTWAWDIFKQHCPDATYKIKTFNGLPYVYDENTGYMVYTEITVEGETHEMWLPVMDSANKAMKAEPYDYKVKNYNFKYAKLNPTDGKYYDKYGNEQVEYEIKHCSAATMFDINKTIMRCLTKNMAMFGLGLYIYAGEDLPEDLTEKEEEQPFVYQRPKCECGKEIEPITKKDGTRMLVGDVVKFSKENYKGRVLCAECMKKVSEEAAQ